MSRCKHELVPLCPRPTTEGARWEQLLCPYQGYVVCKHCGRIGFYTKYRRKLSWFHPEAAERIRAGATEWNARMAEKDRQEEIMR